MAGLQCAQRSLLDSSVNFDFFICGAPFGRRFSLGSRCPDYWEEVTSSLRQQLKPILMITLHVARKLLLPECSAGFRRVRKAQWCRCQKHPCTKMTAVRDGKTMSGRPGRVFTCSRYR